MRWVWKERRPRGADAAGPGTREGAVTLFLTTLWFGLLAGWLELGLVMALGALHPRVSDATLRTNRHLVWMVPVADVLIFAAVGFGIAVLAFFRRRFAHWVASRLPVAMTVSTLLLNVEGLYAVSAAVLAWGLATAIGPRIRRRAESFGRVVRASLPAMAAGLVLWAGLTFGGVVSAERHALAARPPARPGAPNVLLIVLDTVRASCLSLQGFHRPNAPNLARLAGKGVVFTEARATASWTLPTHASLMTGRWPHELSAAPGVPLDGTYPTLAETLGRAGYATAGFVGNIYYCNALYGFGRGFDRFEDAYENQTVSLVETVWSSGLGKRILQALGYPTRFEDGASLIRKSAAMLNRDVLDWLGGRTDGRPFFAFINYYDAHRPYAFHDGPETRYGMAALPDAEQLAIDQRFRDQAEGRPAPDGYTRERIEREALTLFHDSYDTCIAELDRQVGLLIDEIDRRGLLENTLVVVTSDHGEQLGEHGVVSHGVSLYREEVHVPLVVVPPLRAAPGRVVGEAVSLRDVPATVAEWADLGPESPFPGRSLTRFRPDVAGEPGPTSPVLSELQHNIAFHDPSQIPPHFGPASSVESRGCVYIRRNDGGEELYDLRNDPMETVDLARDPQARPALDELRRELGRLSRDAAGPSR